MPLHLCNAIIIIIIIIIMVDRNDIGRIIEEVERENAVFADKGCLDALRTAPEMAEGVVGREDKARELVLLLIGGLGRRYSSPLISVYGRSGSGKSTVVRFVCEMLQESGHVTAFAFVNLRMARMVFGCAHMILDELQDKGGSSAGKGVGTGRIVHEIARAIESLLTGKKHENGHGSFFVLVLDEFDSLFSDRRGRPSDLVYQLLEMQEKLQQGRLSMMSSIIAISNDAVFGHRLDDRVMSRMGSAAQVPFGAYSKGDVVLLLKQKARQAAVECEPDALEYCADICSQEHGDARRAIELFRAACELAGAQDGGRTTTAAVRKEHIDAAEGQLQRDRVNAAVDGAPYHAKAACAALARISYLTGDEWHTMSALYSQYRMVLQKGIQPLSYRRVSELFSGLVDAGLAESSVGSRRRSLSGYGTVYRLTLPPELVGSACFSDWWRDLEEKKKKHDEEERRSWQTRFETRMGQSIRDPFYSEPRVLAMRNIEDQEKARWNEFVGR